MSPLIASHLKTNVLFRVLAFLDNTGTQSFALSEEVDAKGRFKRPGVVFAEDTAISGILAATLDALRASTRRYFASVEEQEALLAVIGTGVVENAPTPWDWTTWISSASNDTSEAPLAPMQQPASPSSRASLPVETKWSALVSHPHSLTHYAARVEDAIPYHLLMRLREVLGVAPPQPEASEAADTAAASVPSTSSCYSNSPLVEQFLIDGIDEWLRRSPLEEVKRMILACGVQPTVLASAFDSAHKPATDSVAMNASSPPPPSSASSPATAVSRTPPALPDSLVDFIVDVIFPVAANRSSDATDPTQSSNCSNTTTADGLPLDWLLLSYEKNHEAVEVDEDDSGSDVDNGAQRTDDEESANGNASPPAHKAHRAESSQHDTASQKRVTEDESSLANWQPEDGEEVLTADNIDRYMRECPQRIPREILREKRKSVADPAITVFELEHHYTAAELRKAVKDDLGSMTAEEATEFMGCPISEAQLLQASRATRKAQFVEWVLAAHRGAAASAQ